MINTHFYGGQSANTKSLDLDKFHREQMRLSIEKIDDLHNKVQYCLRQISLIKDKIDWLMDEK